MRVVPGKNTEKKNGLRTKDQGLGGLVTLGRLVVAWGGAPAKLRNQTADINNILI